MKIKSSDLIAQLERLAEACPWQHVDLWITRRPQGTYSFTAYAREEPKYGLPSGWGHGGSTPKEAVDKLLKEHNLRDPVESRKLAVAKLQKQIEELQAVVIGLPPYIPNRELGNGEATIEVQETITV